MKKSCFMSDLAALYLPDVGRKVASRNFRRWLRVHPTVINELKAVGWRKEQRLLTPKMVEVIYEAFGEP